MTEDVSGVDQYLASLPTDRRAAMSTVRSVILDNVPPGYEEVIQYGMLSYFVTERTREMGIRMALGARRANVLGLVMKQGVRLAVLGIVAGLAGAWGLTRLMSSLLFDVTPTDSVTLVSVALTLALVALLACYVPARRATKVDPLVALREE